MKYNLMLDTQMRSTYNPHGYFFEDTNMELQPKIINCQATDFRISQNHQSNLLSSTHPLVHNFLNWFSNCLLWCCQVIKRHALVNRPTGSANWQMHYSLKPCAKRYFVIFKITRFIIVYDLITSYVPYKI